MQDHQIDGNVIRPELITISLPKQLAEAILASDVTILIASSEQQDQAITVQQVYASGLPQPETVASHAYAKAVRDAHPDLLRSVRGEPTDARRYQALKEFACLAGTDQERFKVVNDMLQKFEEANMADDPAENIAEDHDKMADFLIHALLETTPLVVEQHQPAAN